MVDFSPSYARRHHPDRAIEESIDSIWSSITATNPNIFNGLKFRLASWEYLPTTTTFAGSSNTLTTEENDWDSNKRSKTAMSMRVVLRMWLSDYKTFKGTNWHPQVARLRSDGKAHHGQEEAYLGHKLGEWGFEWEYWTPC